MEDFLKKLGVLLLAVFAVALFASQAQAQSLTYGLKGGFDFSKQSIKTDYTDWTEFGHMNFTTAGIYVNFKLGPVSIQPEFLYTRKGLSWDYYLDDDFKETSYFKCDFIELPILVKYNFDFLRWPVTPYVIAGPAVSYLLNVRYGWHYDYTEESGYTDWTGEYTRYYDDSGYFKRLSFSAIAGVGVSYKLPKFTVSAEVRYDYGLTSISNSTMADDSYWSITSLKNRDLQVMLSIGF
jgi:hypothetical protein